MITKVTSSDLGRGPSVRALARSGIDIQRALVDPGYAVGFFEHFAAFHPLTSSGVSGPWYAFIEGSATFKALVSEVGGVLQIDTVGTDNNGPVLSYGTQAASSTSVPFKIVSGGKPLVGGARIRFSSAALTETGVFVGLAEESRAVDNGLMIDNTTLMADIDHIGFNAGAIATAPVFDAVYVKATGTDVTVANDLLTAALSTWYLLEFSYNPGDDKFRFFLDGELVGSFDVSAAGTTHFPSGEEMTFYIGVKNGENAAKKLDVDFAYCFQLL